MTSGAHRLLVAVTTLCFLLSGTTGLLYQTLWSRALGLFLGHSSYAHAVVLATFMGGLALGNHLFGRRADRTARPLALYAWLEIGIGAFALAFLLIFPGFTSAYIALGSAAGAESAWLLPVKLALAVVSILAPTTLMGGTLPIVTRALVRKEAELGAAIGRLYFVNTAGAVLGCVLGGFALVEALGTDGAMIAAAIANLAIGAVALGVEHLAAPPAPPDPEDEPEPAEPEAPDAAPTAEATPLRAWSRAEVGVALVAIGLGGAVSMLYELVWTRLVAFVFGSSSQSFSVMLISFISGIALGGYLASRLLRRDRDALWWFGAAEIGVALSVLAIVPFYERLPWLFATLRDQVAPSAGGFVIFQALQIALLLVLMALPTTLIGMTLPLASRVVVRSLDTAGAKIGATFSINTVGTVIGALGTGLFVIPALGLQTTLLVGVGLSAALGVMLLATRAEANRLRVAALALALAATFGAVVVGAGRWDPVLLTAGYFRGQEAPESFEAMRRRYGRHRLLFHEDGVDTTVTVIQTDDRRFLKVNGKTDASNHPLDMITQVVSGHLPMLLHRGEARDVLVIGMGSGVTAGTTLLWPEARTRSVEISQAVVDGARLFAEENHGVHDHPRHTLHVGDAKDFLLLHGARWDVIISEPSNPWIAGIASLFSREFFENVRQSLRPNGLYLQWMQLYAFSDEALGRTLNTLRAVFPHVTLWRFSTPDALILASNDPIEPDLGELAARLARPPIRADLNAPGRPLTLRTPADLLAHQVLSAEVVSAAFPGRPPLNSDAHPWLEFEAPRAMFRDEKPALIDGLDERRKPLAECRLLLCRALQRDPPDELERLQLADTLERAGRHDLADAIRDTLGARALPDLAADALAARDSPRLAAAQLPLLLQSAEPFDADTCQRLVALTTDQLKAHVTFLSDPDTADIERLVDRCAEAHPPLATELRARLADLQQRGGHHDDALATAEAALVDDPDDLYLLRVLGRAALQLGDTRRADEAFGRILKLRPRDAEARAWFGPRRPPTR